MSTATARAGAALELARIGQIAITVSDIERAVAFYRDTLGLRPLFEVPGMAFFNCGGIRLMLAASRTLESRGVRFDRLPHLVARMPDHDLWMAFFCDPDRNPLALMSEVKRAAE